MYSLNTKQAEGLAGFFFDIAKGLVLGGIGTTAIIPFQAKYIVLILSGFLAYGCVKMALMILEETGK